jgi:uncharacterized protein CbrC (UPF0167 family)
MRNPGGYAVITSPDPTPVNFDRFRAERISAGTFEADTFTCVHCNRVMHVKPRAPMDEFGSMCRNCMKMVCPRCADGPCVPFEKKLEMWERRSEALRSYGF